MSFSGAVKEELTRQIDSARHCNLAELAAILGSCGSVQFTEEGRTELVVHTENEGIARKCFTLLKKTFNMETVIVADESAHSKRGKGFFLRIQDEITAGNVLEGTKMLVDTVAGGLKLQRHCLITQKECCKRAYIRGAFLASGSISDPNKGYHFEIVFSDEEKAEQLQTMIRSFHIDAKTVLRKKSYVVYVKEGAQIVDMLAIMGASVALMDLENIRILKEMRNSVNRKVNCETANLNKTVNAAVKQIEDIRLIEQKRGFESLPENLSEIAVLRLQYPDATLKELGMMLVPQVGKSGVNHRLRKLSLMAEELRESEEETL
ncbi:MAG: DNA-binding protein WhiA [Eubacteriales bacterium]|nr:DNA-binding protein WhiA [Eubacteriales bacterium]